MKILRCIVLATLVWTVLPIIVSAEDNDITFSRLVIYDVRGIRQDETALILEQRGKTVTVWLKNYLGKRTGTIPLKEYRKCFQAMKRIRGFALKKKYRGRLLRAHAAKGMIALAWKDKDGKQVRTIKYYAPEHTLDDFRAAFNQIWGLSRYAILSLDSFEHQQAEFLEDAVYFLSGSGWITYAELKSVIAYHRNSRQGQRVAKAIWGALDREYPRTSIFHRRSYLEYCVKKGMTLLGEDAVVFMETHSKYMTTQEIKLRQDILDAIQKKELKTIRE
jgi:hypothetical protein